MKNTLRLLFTATLVSTALVGAGAPAAAATAACTWRDSNVPLPPGVSSITLATTDHQGGYGGIGTRTDRLTYTMYLKDGGVRQRQIMPTSTLYDQNRTGTIVGRHRLRHVSIAFRVRGDNNQLELLPTNSAAISNATGINDRGDIVGYIGDSGALWPAANPGTFLLLPGRAADVDEDSTVLLTARDSAGRMAPQLWRNGVGAWLAWPSGATAVTATRISNGRVIGTATTPAGTVGVWWNRDGVPRELPGSVDAVSINRDGLIAGRSTTGALTLWRLGTFEATLSAGTPAQVAVGDDGAVVGWSRVWRCG